MPEFLQKGDKVAIVALSSNASYSYVTAGLEVLTGWGLKPDLSYYADPSRDYQAVADRLVSALKDDSVKALICVRGGYGAIHVLDLIPSEIVAENPKWLVGYSDITAYLWYYFSKGVMSVHGPMCSSWAQVSDDGGSSEKLRKILFGEKGFNRVVFNDGIENRPGKASGILIGGNMDTLRPYLCGEYSPFNLGDDFIVFLEDTDQVNRQFYRIIKELRYTAGKKIKGLIMGDCPLAEDEFQSGTIQSMTLECFPDIPVAFTSKIGHGDVNFPLIEGIRSTLDVASGSKATLRFLNK